MDISCKVKLEIKIYNSMQNQQRLYAHIKYKINKEFFSHKLNITLIDGYIFDINIDFSRLKSEEEFIKECEDLINDMDKLKNIIKNKVTQHINKKFNKKKKEEKLLKLESKVNNIKFNINFKI